MSVEPIRNTTLEFNHHPGSPWTGKVVGASPWRVWVLTEIEGHDHVEEYTREEWDNEIAPKARPIG